MDREYTEKLINDALAKFLSGETVKNECPFICDRDEEFWLEPVQVVPKGIGNPKPRDMWELTQLFSSGVERVGLYDNDVMAAIAFVNKVVASRVSAHFERIREDELAKEYLQ
jgi:hypothetical protein